MGQLHYERMLHIYYQVSFYGATEERRFILCSGNAIMTRSVCAALAQLVERYFRKV